MSRYIDADALETDMIQVLERVAFFAPIEEIYGYSEEQIKNAPSIEIPQWISCSERLPEEKQNVLTYSKEGNIMVGAHIEGIWYFPWYADDIIAWMPLPEPYRERNE